MKSLLFALGLALCCSVQAEWKKMTSASKEDLGRWLTLAVACNSSEALWQLKEMTAFATDVSVPEENVVSISSLIHMPDGCKNVTHQFRKEEDGNYHTVSSNTALTEELKVESVKVLDKFIMSTIKVGEKYRLSSLHSRNVTQEPGIFQKFKEECKQLGYSEDEIVVLNSPVKCL